MARELLTDKRVSNMRPPTTGRKETFDTVKTGLCYRVTANGSRSWSLVYRFDGELRRDTLGPYPKIGLAKARKMAGDALELVGQGKDPRETKATAEAAEAARQADTVAAVAEQFIAKHASQRRWGELERILRRDVMPEWKSRPVSDITRREVIDLLDTIAERAPIQANRTLTVLSIFFGWCLDRDIIPADPTNRVPKPTKESPRERVLTEPELAAFWKGCDRLGWPFGPLLQLLALTGQRKGEIGNLIWSEIDTKEKLINLAGSRYKTGRPHIVPLSNAAMAIIEDLPRIGEKSGLVFTTNDKTAVSGFSKAKDELDGYMLEELRKDAEAPAKVTLAPWRIHDLRRTCRSGLSRLGVLADIGERVLGHAIPGLRGVYDRHDFLPQMRDALNRWAAHLDGIVNPRPGKVARFRKQK
jgi:integrase